MRRIVLLVLLGALAAPVWSAAPRTARGQAARQVKELPREVQTSAYTVHSDLPPEVLEGVLHRLERMTEEYRSRTAVLSSRQDDRRLPLFLFAREADYLEAGGTAGSAGFFDGERLLAWIGEKPDVRAWHIIQHEAFHQFLLAKLGYDLPIWLNEGMAEYFGEGIYTGDGFVTGLTPRYRVQRLRRLGEKEENPLERVIGLTHDEWNSGLAQDNYDIAWSLVHFLAQAEEGKHQDELVGFIRASANGKDPRQLFTATVGPIDAVEKQWREYWEGISPQEVNRGYSEVALQTVCSYVVRASMARQQVKSIEDLAELAKSGELRQPEQDTLPMDVLLECMQWAKNMGEWRFDYGPRAAWQVELTMADGPKLYARAQLRGGKIWKVETWSNEKARAGRKGRMGR